MNALEDLLVIRFYLREWEIDADVGAPPIVATANLPVPVVLPDHGKLCVERYAHTRVAGQLKRGAIVEGAHH